MTTATDGPPRPGDIRTQTNFGGNHTWQARCYQPASEQEVLEILDRHRQGHIRAMGSKHSWSDVAACSDVSLDMSKLNQVYVHGYFHADPHPANLIVLPRNVIAYVDFGIVGKVSTELRDSLRFFAHHLFDADIDTAVSQSNRRELCFLLSERYGFYQCDPFDRSACPPVRAAHRVLGRARDRLQTGGCRCNEMDRADQPAACVSHAGWRRCSHLRR